MAKANLFESVKGLGDVYEVRAPLDEQLKALQDVGIKYPISVRDASYLRLKGEKPGSIYGTRTCHAPILAKDSPVVVARISPLIEDGEMARKAVEAHRNGNYPQFNEDVYGRWHDLAEKEKRKKPEDRRAILLDKREDHPIHVDSDQAKFLFQGARKRYFDRFVNGDSIRSYQISPNIVDSQEGTLINYLWFYSVDGGSYLNFGGRNLYYDDRSFGVLKGVAKPLAPQKLQL